MDSPGNVFNCVYNILIMTSKELIRMLERAGWFRVANRGSHHQFKHPVKPGRVTVPHPKKDLRKGTVNSVLRQAGIK